nr:uncharacterized protein LOC111857611 [Paramormyrops kingsleyae]
MTELSPNVSVPSSGLFQSCIETTLPIHSGPPSVFLLKGFPVHTRLTRESTTIKLVAGKVVCYASTSIVDIAEHTPFYNRVQTDLAAWAFVMGLGLDGVLVTYHWADIRTKIQPKERNQHGSQGDRATKHSPKIKGPRPGFLKAHQPRKEALQTSSCHNPWQAANSQQKGHPCTQHREPLIMSTWLQLTGNVCPHILAVGNITCSPYK